MMANKTWADIFIEECIDQGVTKDREIIKTAKENTETYSNKVIQLVRSRETGFNEEIDFVECSCGSELMYDSKSDESYCPICD